MATIAFLSVGWQLYSAYKTTQKVGRIAKRLSKGKMPKALDVASVLFGTFGVDLEMIPDGVISHMTDAGLPDTQSQTIAQNDLEATAQCGAGHQDSGTDAEEKIASDLTQGEIDITRPIIEEALAWACENCVGGDGMKQKESSASKVNEMVQEMSFEELADAVFRAIMEWEDYCLSMQQEYDDLLAITVPIDEEAQLEYVERLSLVSSKLEAAQTSLAELKSRLSTVASDSALALGGSLDDGVYAGRSIGEWEEACLRLQRQYDQIKEKEVPIDETSQVQHFEALTITAYRLEAAQINLAELRSRLGETYKNLQDQYIKLVAKEVPVDEDAQITYIQKLSLVTQRIENYQSWLET